MKALATFFVEKQGFRRFFFKNFEIWNEGVQDFFLEKIRGFSFSTHF
jgi:hypothetical protein